MARLSEESLELLLELRRQSRRAAPVSRAALLRRERLQTHLSQERSFLLGGCASLAVCLERLCVALVTEGVGRPLLFEWKDGLASPVSEERRRRLHRLSADSPLLRVFERRLLACVRVPHRCRELEAGSVVVAAAGERLAELLEFLSSGQAFLSPIPEGASPFSLPPWILTLPAFSLGQFIAARLEAEVWASWQRESGGRPTSSKNSEVARVIAAGLAVMGGKGPSMTADCAARAVRELVLDRDEEKLRR